MMDIVAFQKWWKPECNPWKIGMYNLFKAYYEMKGKHEEVGEGVDLAI